MLSLRLLLLLLAGLAAGGCVTRQLEPDFTAFSTAYADNMNWQMLLNLARLDQGHPAYFMAIGEIRLGRTQSASAQLGGTSSHTTGQTVAASVSKTVTNVLSGTVTPNVSNSASPTFVFIPINSEEAAKQLLSPISIDVFNSLYQQGCPVDQLMRVLVERIEVDIPAEGDQPAQHIVLVNSPTRGSAKSFARFLRVCEIVHDLQQGGGLNLIAEDRFSPISNAEVPAIAAKEVHDAADKGRSWQKNTRTNGWQLGTLRQSYRFQANRAIVDDVIGRFKLSTQPDYQLTLDNLHTVLSATVSASTDNTAPRSGPRATLILRSFRNVLEAVAAEQRPFAELAADAAFAKTVPPRQLRPVLQLTWDDSSVTLAPPAAQVTYAGRRYLITDPAGAAAANLDSRWNRDVFRLLVNLSAQVTVDITKFQRQVLELN